MAKGLTVIHVEDEYEDLVGPWSRRFCRLINTFMRENGLPDANSQPRKVVVPGLEGAKVAIRDIESPAGNGVTYRYIFVGDVEISPELMKQASGLVLFVVDVLRDTENGAGKEKPAIGSLKCIKALGGTADNVVIFTALQGDELTQIRKEFPEIQIIRKLHSFQLDQKFVQFLVRSLASG